MQGKLQLGKAKNIFSWISRWEISYGRGARWNKYKGGGLSIFVAWGSNFLAAYSW